MFLIFGIETLFGVFYLENITFMLGKFWIVQNLALLGPYLAPFAPKWPKPGLFGLYLRNRASDFHTF
jgi:hypothetical protein